MINKTINGMAITCESEERAYEIARDHFNPELIIELEEVNNIIKCFISKVDINDDDEVQVQLLAERHGEIIVALGESS